MMNLPVILTKALAGARTLGGNGLLLAKKHAPEIMIGSGLIGFVVTVIETVHATNATNEILEERDENLAKCERALEAPTEVYSQEDYNKDVHMIKRQAQIDLIKTWIPVGTSGIASVIFVLKGYRIINGRYVATAAAYKGLEAGFERYRGNVVERFGEEVDKELLYTTKKEDIEKARKEAEERRIQSYDIKRPKTSFEKGYLDQIFDQESLYWRRNWTPDQVMDFLRQVEREMQDKLILNGHVFWNEVLDRCGMRRTSEGSVVGWIMTTHNKHDRPGERLSLGLDTMPESEMRRILSARCNSDIWVRLQPNCDGLIYQLIDLPIGMREFGKAAR